MKRSKNRLVASVMTATIFTQKMVKLGLGEDFEIEQLELDFREGAADDISVFCLFTVFKPLDHKPTKYPDFMGKFTLMQFEHVRGGPKKWGISSADKILMCCNSPLEGQTHTNHAEFAAVNPMEIKLSKSIRDPK